MNQTTALKQLMSWDTPVFDTRDAAALLRISSDNARMTLSRLAKQGFLMRLKRGRWALVGKVSNLALPELLTAPYPAYVSLQSALFHHGLIEQIPAVTYAVTLGRTRSVATPLGSISFHRMPPELFTGFVQAANDQAKIATPEKALFDVLYLAPGRSRLFARLPELDIPRSFRWKELVQYNQQVRSKMRRSFISQAIETIKAKRPR
jgi:predicted transcriptional regulator of viral defense system